MLKMSTKKQVFVSAREIYDEFGLKKPFCTWMNAKIKSLDLEENCDYVVFFTQGNKINLLPKKGRPQKEYLISKRVVHLISKGDMELNVSLRTGIKKERVLQLLKKWAFIEEDMTDIDKQIKELQDELSSIPEPDGIEYREGLKSTKIVDETFQKVSKIEHLSKNLDILIKKYQAIESDHLKIQELILKLDYQERILIEYRYLKLWQWFNIAKELKISEINCKRYHNEIIEKLTVLYE